MALADLSRRFSTGDQNFDSTYRVTRHALRATRYVLSTVVVDAPWAQKKSCSQVLTRCTSFPASAPPGMDSRLAPLEPASPRAMRLAP